MNINQYQSEQIEDNYRAVKYAIIQDIQRHIRNNLDCKKVTYTNNSSFSYKIEGGFSIPIWIYSHIERYYDRLVEDLKLDGITLIKDRVYKERRIGFFKRKYVSVPKEDCFILKW